MVESFGTALAAVLEAAGMTQMRFADRVGLNQGQLSRILAGKRRPPLDALARWFEVLALAKSQRERLLLLAHLAHATPWLRTYVQGLHPQGVGWSLESAVDGRRRGRVVENDSERK